MGNFIYFAIAILVFLTFFKERPKDLDIRIALLISAIAGIYWPLTVAAGIYVTIKEIFKK